MVEVCGHPPSSTTPRAELWINIYSIDYPMHARSYKHYFRRVLFFERLALFQHRVNIWSYGGGEMMCRRYIEGFVEECLKAPQTTNPSWDQACAVNSLHFLVEQLSLFTLFGWDHFAAQEDFACDGDYGGHKWKIHFMIEHLYVSRCYPLAKLKNFKKFSN